MKRTFLAALALLFCLTGCGGGTYDPDAVAQAVIEQVDFVNELSPAQGDVALHWYALDDSVAEHAIYIDGSGGSAEEVAVLKAVQGADIADLEAIVDKRLRSLQAMFENYRPDEMRKINDPVIVSKGDVVVLCLADDPAQAREVVESLLR